MTFDIISNTPPEGVAQTLEFVGRVVPAQGHYCIDTVRGKGMRHEWFSTLEALVTRAVELHNTPGVYYAPAAYSNISSRTAQNVRAKRALYVDIDVGPDKLRSLDGNAYPTTNEAAKALGGFIRDTGLRPTYILLSGGGGLHVYWALDRDVTPEEWKRLAAALAALCRAHGLKVDTSVTESVNTLLRLPGALHKSGQRATLYKPGKAPARIWGVEEIGKVLGVDTASVPALPTTAARFDAKALAVNDDALPEYRPFSLMKAAQGCGALHKAMAGKGEGVPRAVWVLMVGTAKASIEGRDAAHDFSSGHEDYTEADTDKTLDSLTGGPARCEAWASAYGAGGPCDTCQYLGKVKSPVPLGYEVAAAPADGTNGTPEAGAPESGALATIESSGGVAVVDQDGAVNYVKHYSRDGRHCRDVVKSGTQAAADMLMYAAMSGGGKPPSERAIAAAEAKLRVEAKQWGESVRVARRVACVGGVYYHYLKPGLIARIAADGWELTDEGPDTPLFRRGTGAGELPTPEFNGDARSALDHLVDSYQSFGIDKTQAVVAAVLLVDALMPETTHPIREYVGASGSGKSTMAEHDLSLVDPAESGRRTTGQRVEDIAAAAQHHYAISIDNASRFDKTTSDALCTASTGGTLHVRQLYTQGETAALELHSPVYVSGVAPVCTAPDLQTRVIRFELQGVAGRSFLGEPEMRERMSAARPAMLGATYTLMAAALKALPDVRSRHVWAHRMVSFDQLGEAVVTAAGGAPGAFLKIVERERARMASRTASGDVFTLKLLDLLRTLAGSPKTPQQPTLRSIVEGSNPIGVWELDDGRIEVTARPRALRDRIPPASLLDRDNAMPTTDRAFLDALRRVQPMLGAMGITCSEPKYGTRPCARFVFDPKELAHV